MKLNPSEIHLIASLVALPGKEEELREVSARFVGTYSK